jgi:hypothetical protein
MKQGVEQAEVPDGEAGMRERQEGPGPGSMGALLGDSSLGHQSGPAC